MKGLEAIVNKLLNELGVKFLIIRLLVYLFRIRIELMFRAYILT